MMRSNTLRVGRVTCWLLLILLATGCLPVRNIERIRANPDGMAVVTLPLEAVSAIQGSILDASASGDGSLWFLDGDSRSIWMLPPTEGTPSRIPLVDESGQSLLDPFRIDATAGLSVLVVDRTLNRVFRYDRNGALLAAWSIPEPGPSAVEMPLGGGEQGARAALGALTAMSGDRVAILDRSAPRLFLVDEQAADVRIVALPSAASAVTFHAGRLVLATLDGQSLFIVSTSGVLELIVDIDPYHEASGTVDAASLDGSLYLLSADGSLRQLRGLDTPHGPTPLRTTMYRPSPDDGILWSALVAKPDALWWLGNGRVYRTARPR